MTVKVKDKDNMTEGEKRRVWKERYKPAKRKATSRVRTEKELMNDDRVWEG